MKQLSLVAYGLLLLGSSITNLSAETRLLEDSELRAIVGQAVTAQQREAAQDLGELVCLVICPTSQSLFLGVSLELSGGVTGALFGVNGDFGTGFIGSALSSIEKAFDL